MADLSALVAAAHAGLDGRLPPPSGDGGDDALTGEALDGQVRAVMSPEGRLEALTIDPRALRLPLTDLRDAIVVAVDAANSRRGGVDVAPAVAALRQVRVQASAEAASLLAGLDTAATSVRSIRQGR